MARIEFKALGHSYSHHAPAHGKGAAVAPQYALQPMNQVWRDGGAYALLGPSGCGKTTLLNIISGLVVPSEGRVLFNGVDVTDLSTAQRNIAQVFQFPVIYDTMTVFENLAFPLRNRRVPEAEVKRRAEQVAEMLELGAELHKRAANLSADAKQKISLGRGLVRHDVAAILFDEPLTVIDPHLKWTLRRKLKQIHQELKLTLIYVTHDQTEALTFADEVIVMYEGRIVQSGTPQQLFEHPAHRFVGHFVGSPGMNFMPCVLNGNGAVVDGVAIGLAPGVVELARKRGGRLEIGVRPEFLRLESAPRENAAPVQVQAVEDLGNYRIATVRLGHHQLKVKVPEEQAVPRESGYLAFTPALTKLYADGALVG
ncbi:MAG TPA: ABC transporter ATP-binding protein [Burkholderiaceae bacterium]|nr:ABC transporter ATP-binding protein [Burkholderiaceae bacterium]